MVSSRSLEVFKQVLDGVGCFSLNWMSFGEVEHGGEESSGLDRTLETFQAVFLCSSPPAPFPSSLSKPRNGRRSSRDGRGSLHQGWRGPLLPKLIGTEAENVSSETLEA